MYIQHIATMVPENCYPQEEIMKTMIEKLAAPPTINRYIRRIYKQSGIENRHSVIPNFTTSKANIFFANGHGRQYQVPGTGLRNELFLNASRKLFVTLAHTAIDQCCGHSRGDITHVITVSCTGFYNPGPDYYIVRELALPDTVQRFNLGFMGCYAAIPALKMARAFCDSEEDAVVLVVCVELCTLHFQDSHDLDAILAGSLFADGGSAAIISNSRPDAAKTTLKMDGFRSSLIPSAESEMAWIVGDTGFSIVLSRYIAEIINCNVPDIIENFLKLKQLKANDIGVWAVHPGGRAILDKLQQSFDLQDVQIQASRKVLRRYGNMSSATIFFVLKEILNNSDSGISRSIFAIAFGPGLTVESAIFTCEPARVPGTDTITAHVNRLPPREPVSSI